MRDQTAWLMLSAQDGRFAGSSGYNDDVTTSYEWDSSIPNAHGPQPGDLVLIWDKRRSLGASVIQEITTSDGIKDQWHCPRCGSTSIKTRRHRTPLYHCHSAGCAANFDVPNHSSKEVTLFRTNHAAGWVDLAGMLTGHEVRLLADSPKSQHSIRACRRQVLLDAIATISGPTAAQQFVATEDVIRGGHRKTVVRVRIGQAKFRAALLESFGPICAFTGPTHQIALEAAHLYSYAQSGEHVVGGGLLLRRDLHRLFDAGLIGVDPASRSIALAPELQQLHPYGELATQTLRVPLSNQQLAWLRLHWEEHFSLETAD